MQPPPNAPTLPPFENGQIKSITLIPVSRICTLHCHSRNPRGGDRASTSFCRCPTGQNARRRILTRYRKWSGQHARRKRHQRNQASLVRRKTPTVKTTVSHRESLPPALLAKICERAFWRQQPSVEINGRLLVNSDDESLIERQHRGDGRRFVA